MNNFKIIYRILKYLEAALDVASPDMTPIKAESLGLTEERWKALMLMLHKEGYIEGLSFKQYVGEESVMRVEKVKITLKGLEYLEENSLMQKIKNAAMDVVDIIT
ncbi:MAG: hypothetical protein II062_03965 [Oscillospiraceae bacterium]|nr:hypothetical protein [Oscillospiraceae bacterium]